MNRRFLVLVVGGIGLGSALSQSSVAGRQAPAPAARAAAGSASPQAASPQTTARRPLVSETTASQAAQYQAVVNEYCVTCHNDRLKTAGLTLEPLNLADVREGAEHWEKVLRKLKLGMMPPLGVRRPDPVTYEGLAVFVGASLDRAAGNQPLPSPLGMHRMNRAEYANAIRDLLALDVDVARLLPPDDSSYGFDNVADVLGISPALQERYLSAAGKISALAVGDAARLRRTEEETFAVPPNLTQLQHLEGLPLGTRGGALFQHVFPLDGEYQFAIKLFRTHLAVMRGMATPSTLIVVIDGEQVFEASVGGKDDRAEVDANDVLGGDAVDARLRFRVPVTAGPHAVGVTFLQKTEAEELTILQPFAATLDNQDPEGVPKLHQLKIAGPFNPAGVGDTPSRRRIFTCRPTRLSEEETCARTILTTMARRAYRRPVTATETQVLMNFYERGRADSNFDSAIGYALQYILANPNFVFRVERDPVGVAAGAAYRLNDFELASRLSFFLWSSIPDDQLLTVAARGRLAEPAELTAQVRRMLADPRASALTDNFAGQWLWLRNLNSVTPNFEDFPDFDNNLRDAMRQESSLLFDGIVRENRSVLDLLDADYTFVNERLARHYGIPGVYGSRMRRVAVSDNNRRGLLGHGSFLTVTSVPDRTSPVKRGKWVLENLLGTTPPEPPPNVPTLPQANGAKPKTLREEMEAHRANPTCASCHKLMDPIGFALDNFDAIGQWRDLYPGTASAPGTPIDAAGQLADGTQINGVADLRQALLKKPENFVETITSKLMIYGLGRGLGDYDMPTIRAIVRDAARTNYRFQSIAMGIVTSQQFQMRTKASQEPAATVAGRQ